MRTETLHLSVDLSAPRDEVFAWHTDPARLGELLADEPGLELLRHDGHVRPGAETWLRVRGPLGVPVVLGFRHLLLEPPHRFAEEMVRGPFARFHHLHVFEEVDGGCRVVDELELAWPAYLGGGLALRRLVLPRVRAQFARRHAVLRRVFSPPATGPAAPPAPAPGG